MGPNCHLSGCLPRTPFLQCMRPPASAKLSQPMPAQLGSLDPRFYFHRGIYRCPDYAAQRSRPWFPWMVHPFLSTWLLPQPAGSPLWQDDILDQTALHPRVSVQVSPDVEQCPCSLPSKCQRSPFPHLPRHDNQTRLQQMTGVGDAKSPTVRTTAVGHSPDPTGHPRPHPPPVRMPATSSLSSALAALVQLWLLVSGFDQRHHHFQFTLPALNTNPGMYFTLNTHLSV